MSNRNMRSCMGIICAECGNPVEYEKHREIYDEGHVIYYSCKNVCCNNNNHLPDNANLEELKKRGFKVKTIIIFE